MSFDTILFDLDDTIHDRNKSLFEFVDVFKLKYNQTIDSDSALNLKDTFFEIDCQGYKPREEMFKELLHRVSWKSRPNLKEMIEFWNTEFPKCAKPMENLYNVLEFLNCKKVKMGIVTNGNSSFQNSKIDKLDLRKFMKTIIISEEVNIKKPDPKIFLLALSEIGASKQSCLFVGDNPLWDIKGAIDAGLDSAWLSNGHEWTIEEYKPRHIIRNLLELMQIR